MNILASNKISFSEKHYKKIIGYLYGDNETKQLKIMVRKMKAYVKC